MPASAIDIVDGDELDPLEVTDEGLRAGRVFDEAQDRLGTRRAAIVIALGS